MSKLREIENDIDAGWSWFSAQVRAHPKMGIFICLVIGVLIDHYLVSLVW